MIDSHSYMIRKYYIWKIIQRISDVFSFLMDFHFYGNKINPSESRIHRKYRWILESIEKETRPKKRNNFSNVFCSNAFPRLIHLDRTHIRKKKKGKQGLYIAHVQIWKSWFFFQLYPSYVYICIYTLYGIQDPGPWIHVTVYTDPYPVPHETTDTVYH